MIVFKSSVFKDSSIINKEVVINKLSFSTRCFYIFISREFYW